MTTTSSAPAGAEAGTSRTGSNRLVQKQRSPSDGADSSCGAREPWISTNKILNSSLCGRRINSRNPNFDYDETKLLISLWGDPQVQKTLITTHKKHPVIAELARKMRDHGYNRSTEEINTRIKNLKCFYNRIKKDMAAGIINQTTWRHYAEMDEIISRPVFGNAHRAHLIQQQKQNQDDQQNTKSDDTPDDSKDEIHQFPVKLELMSDDDEEDDDDDATQIRAEDLLTIDTTFPEDAPVAPGGNPGRTAAKNGVAIKAVRAANGRNSKPNDEDEDDEEEDEDDDDDDEGSDFDVENEFNDGLDELLQKAQASKSNVHGGSVPKPTAPGLSSGPNMKPGNASGLVIETITSGNGTTITATSASSTSVPTAGKISVVPTNLLMKQPTASSSMTTPIQIYTPPTVSIAKGGPTMVASTGAGTGIGGVPPAGVAPMKLLLVNTVSKDGTTQQILTPASEATTMPKLIPPAMQHSRIPLTVGGQKPIVTIPAMNVPKAAGEPAKMGRGTNGQAASGFRTLITQLVAIQRENLAINQERLALEKERLQFEKQLGGPLVSMVRNMSTFFSGMLQHQRKEMSPAASNRAPELLDKLKTQRASNNAESDTSSLIVTERPPSEVREISSTPSSRASTPRATTPSAGVTKSPASDNEGEKMAKAPAKRAEMSSPPPLTPAPMLKANSSQVSPSSAPDVLLPKKRRMMTRNSTQQSHNSSAEDDPLKMEVVSDSNEH